MARTKQTARRRGSKFQRGKPAANATTAIPPVVKKKRVIKRKIVSYKDTSVPIKDRYENYIEELKEKYNGLPWATLKSINNLAFPSIELKDDTYTIGKNSQLVNIVVDHMLVSSKHCSITKHINDGIVTASIIDFSTNGTFINEKKIDKYLNPNGESLNNGDELMLAKSKSYQSVSYRFELTNRPEKRAIEMEAMGVFTANEIKDLCKLKHIDCNTGIGVSKQELVKIYFTGIDKQKVYNAFKKSIGDTIEEDDDDDEDNEEDEEEDQDEEVNDGDDEIMNEGLNGNNHNGVKLPEKAIKKIFSYLINNQYMGSVDLAKFDTRYKLSLITISKSIFKHARDTLFGKMSLIFIPQYWLVDKTYKANVVPHLESPFNAFHLSIRKLELSDRDICPLLSYKTKPMDCEKYLFPPTLQVMVLHRSPGYNGKIEIEGEDRWVEIPTTIEVPTVTKLKLISVKDSNFPCLSNLSFPALTHIDVSNAPNLEYESSEFYNFSKLNLKESQITTFLFAKDIGDGRYSSYTFKGKPYKTGVLVSNGRDTPTLTKEYRHLVLPQQSYSDVEFESTVTTIEVSSLFNNLIGVQKFIKELSKLPTTCTTLIVYLSKLDTITKPLDYSFQFAIHSIHHTPTKRWFRLPTVHKYIFRR